MNSRFGQRKLKRAFAPNMSFRNLHLNGDFPTFFSWVTGTDKKVAGSGELSFDADLFQTQLGNLWDSGVRAIVTLTEEALGGDGGSGVQVAEERGFKCLHLPTVDLTPPSLPDLIKGCQFIESIEGGVLVHCREGIGRTGTLLAAWLVHSQGMDARHAIEGVRACRAGSLHKKSQEVSVHKFCKLYADDELRAMLEAGDITEDSPRFDVLDELDAWVQSLYDAPQVSPVLHVDPLRGGSKVLSPPYTALQPVQVVNTSFSLQSPTTQSSVPATPATPAKTPVRERSRSFKTARFRRFAPQMSFRNLHLNGDFPTFFSWVTGTDKKVAGSGELSFDADLFQTQLGNLWDSGVRAIVTLTEEALGGDGGSGVQVAEERGFKCLHLPTVDLTPPSLPDLIKGCQFIESIEGGVLVHCREGIGRTGTLLAAWLVHSQGMDARHAIEGVRACRAGSLHKKSQEVSVHKFCKLYADDELRAMLEAGDITEDSPRFDVDMDADASFSFPVSEDPFPEIPLVASPDGGVLTPITSPTSLCIMTPPSALRRAPSKKTPHSGLTFGQRKLKRAFAPNMSFRNLHLNGDFPTFFSWVTGTDKKVAGSGELSFDTDLFQTQLGNLWDSGVRAIVTLTEEALGGDGGSGVQVAEERGFKCLHLPTVDLTPPSLPDLIKGCQFIESIEGGVLVHCREGIGRTGTLLAAWLVHSQGMDARHAIEGVRACRAGSLHKKSQEVSVHKFCKLYADDELRAMLEAGDITEDSPHFDVLDDLFGNLSGQDVTGGLHLFRDITVVPVSPFGASTADTSSPTAYDAVFSPCNLITLPRAATPCAQYPSHMVATP